MSDVPQREPLGQAAIANAMQVVPREAFVPPEYRERARENAALPIGYRQTISQPSLVAQMLELLELRPGDKVLEIGTGSGYQTALLAELGMQVYSLEIIPELAEQAAQRLEALGWSGIHLTVGDGFHGWPEHAPYQAITVAAAARRVPPPLAEQLAEGGRLLIPIHVWPFGQVLRRYVKQGQRLISSQHGWVAFVPFTGQARRDRQITGAARRVRDWARWLRSLLGRRSNPEARRQGNDDG